MPHVVRACCLLSLFFCFLGWPHPRPARAATCSLTSGSVTVGFGLTASARDPSTTATGWGSGALTTGHAQGAFPSTGPNPQQGTLGRRILAAASGKVAGYNDLVQPFVFVTNTGGCSVNFWRYASVLDASLLYSNPPQLNTSTTYVIDAAASCAAGVGVAVSPVDEMTAPADSKADVVVITPQNALFEGTVANAALYIADRAPTSDAFTKVDITGILQQAGVAFHDGTPFTLSDVDGDGRADLLVASSHDTVNELLVFYADPPPTTNYTFSTYEVLIADLGLTPPFADATHAVTGTVGCANGQAMRSVGASHVVRQDIDGDGIADVLISSSSEAGPRVFKGTGPTSYVRQDDITTPGNAGTLQLLAHDFTGDLTRDVVAVRSGWGCQGKSGEARLLRNDGAGNLTAINPTFPAPLSNIDWVAPVKIDLTGSSLANRWYDRSYGMLYGKRTDAGNYDLWSNYPAKNYYNVTSMAQSTSLTKGVANLGNLVDVTVSNLTASLPSGTSIDLYVSADDGAHWEVLTAAERSGATAHAFASYGADLRWKAVLRAPTTTVSGESALYTPVAAATPKLSGFTLSYRYAPPQRISKSKAAYITLRNKGSKNDQLHEYSYVAAFDTPAMTGHFLQYVYDVNSAGNANVLEAVTSQEYDAYYRTRAETASGRTLYASQRTATMTNGSMRAYPLRRITFNAATLQSTANTPTLAQQLNLAPATAAARLAQLRLGVNPNDDTGVMRDPGHGTPAAWNEPVEDANYMGDGYAAYQENAAVHNAFQVLLSTNDGFLHQYHGRTMIEEWGIAPYNVLDRLPMQIGVNKDGSIRYQHQTLVEGPITIAEAYSAATGWRNVAFVGQGQGTSSSGSNYYFAVDITDQDQPQPLWEFTDGQAGGTRTCNPDPCQQKTCTYPYANSAVGAQQNVTFGSELALNKTNVDAKEGVYYGLLDAEHYDFSFQGTNPAGVDWVIKSGTTGMASDAHLGAYITPSRTNTDCVGGDLKSVLRCPQVGYSMVTDYSGAGWHYPLFRLVNAPGGTRLSYALDNNLLFSGSPTFVGTATNGWQWAYGPATYLAAGQHQFTVFMLDANMALDVVAFKPTNVALQKYIFETPTTEYVRQAGTVSCTNSCLTRPSTQEWPSCGKGSGQKCCASSMNASVGFCQDVSVACSAPTSNAGYTLSAPSVGRILTSAGGKWVAFFASGESATPNLPNAGRTVYMVDALTGTPLGSWTFPLTGATNPNINPAVPGAVTLVDSDNDGYVDRLYVGDLAGRLWKINTNATASLNAAGAMSNPNQYTQCVVMDAGNPEQTGSRRWAPILTKPAVMLIDPNRPNVYFGTGGHPQAPTNVPYSFYSVRDNDPIGSCASRPRTESSLTTLQNEWKVTEPAGSGQFWGDPLIVDGRAVYFTSTEGDPDAINPCVAASATSHFYGVAIRKFTDASGRVHQIASSVLNNGQSYYTIAGAVRSGLTARQRTVSQVTRPVSLTSAAAKTDVLVQDYAGNLMRVSTVGGAANDGKRLQVTRYREIPQW